MDALGIGEAFLVRAAARPPRGHRPHRGADRPLQHAATWSAAPGRLLRHLAGRARHGLQAVLVNQRARPAHPVRLPGHPDPHVPARPFDSPPPTSTPCAIDVPAITRNATGWMVETGDEVLDYRRRRRPLPGAPDRCSRRRPQLHPLGQLPRPILEFAGLPRNDDNAPRRFRRPPLQGLERSGSTASPPATPTAPGCAPACRPPCSTPPPGPGERARPAAGPGCWPGTPPAGVPDGWVLASDIAEACSPRASARHRPKGCPTCWPPPATPSTCRLATAASTPALIGLGLFIFPSPARALAGSGGCCAPAGGSPCRCRGNGTRVPLISRAQDLHRPPAAGAQGAAPSVFRLGRPDDDRPAPRRRLFRRGASRPPPSAAASTVPTPTGRPSLDSPAAWTRATAGCPGRRPSLRAACRRPRGPPRRRRLPLREHRADRRAPTLNGRRAGFHCAGVRRARRLTFGEIEPPASVEGASSSDIRSKRRRLRLPPSVVARPACPPPWRGPPPAPGNPRRSRSQPASGRWAAGSPARGCTFPAPTTQLGQVAADEGALRVRTSRTGSPG